MSKFSKKYQDDLPKQKDIFRQTFQSRITGCSIVVRMFPTCIQTYYGISML